MELHISDAEAKVTNNQLNPSVAEEMEGWHVSAFSFLLAFLHLHRLKRDCFDNPVLH